MIEKTITDLKEAVYKKDTQLINGIEMVIAKNIKEYLKNQLFYTLLEEEIFFESFLSIIEKIEINDIDTICTILNKASEYKEGKIAPLLLYYFKHVIFSFDEIIKIMSSLDKINICNELNDVYIIESQSKINEVNDEINKKDKEIKEIEEKINVVKFLVEECKLDPNIENKFE